MSFGVEGKIEILGSSGPRETWPRRHERYQPRRRYSADSFQQSPTVDLHLSPFLPFRLNTRI